MTPKTLAKLGREITGSNRWKRPLARRLSVRPRIVRRWADGHPIPDWAAEKIRSECGTPETQ